MNEGTEAELECTEAELEQFRRDMSEARALVDRNAPRIPPEQVTAFDIETRRLADERAYRAILARRQEQRS